MSISKLTVLLSLLFASNAFALSITNVAHSPVYVNEDTQKVKVRFKNNSASRVVLKIYDDRQLMIRSVEKNDLQLGDNTIEWNLLDNRGNKVPPEAYSYTIEALSDADSVLYDPTDKTGGDFVTLQNIVWDKNNNQIRYVLNKPARVSIRIGIDNGGPLIASVVNWTPRARGEHIEKWTGMDDQNQIDINKLANTIIHARAYSLSTNAIIIGPAKRSAEYVANITWPIERRAQSDKRPSMFDYMSKTPDKRGDYSLTIKLPLEEDGEYSGLIPVRIDLNARDKNRMLQDRFEPILFVDGQFASELETGFFPLTWRLDTRQFSNGNHYITVNLRGYDGQFGVASRSITIRN